MTDGSDSGNNTQIKDNMKLKMYETFINRIEKERELFWKYMSIYFTFMIGINGIIGYINKTDIKMLLIILSFINLILSIIGIVIIIESNKWFFRNMMVVSNIENKILGKDEHTTLIPNSYTELDTFNKVLDTNSLIFVSLFATIFIFSIVLLDVGFIKALNENSGELLGYSFLHAVVSISSMSILDFNVVGVLYKNSDTLLGLDYHLFIRAIVCFFIIWAILAYFIRDNDLISFIRDKKGILILAILAITLIIPILLFLLLGIPIISINFLEIFFIAGCGIFICGVCYTNAKNSIKKAMDELKRNPESPENIKKCYAIYRLSKAYYLIKEADGEERREKLKKSKELIEEAIKLLGRTPTTETEEDRNDFAKIRIREAINGILNNNIDEAINKLNEALKIINNEIGD